MQRFIILATLIAIASAQLCKGPGELVPNPINCQEFFMCRTGRVILFSCPANTLFNPRTLACDSTNKVRCEFGSLPNNVLTSALKAAPAQIEHTVTACINRPISTLLPNPTDCSRFYQCSVTGSIGFECPLGTLFDTQQKLCVERNDAICGTVAQPNPPTIPIQPPSLPIVPPTLPIVPPALPIVPPVAPIPPNSDLNSLQMLCRGKPVGTKVRNPTNCREFVNCIGSNTLRYTTCPSGTAFDDVRKTCDWVQNVKC
ncbi:probable endochitinase [Anopheles ziemanni]|uniref:probable endochitinase n=1 Tax=Anopheles coustani TaxID=139045 RepID=UPI002658EFDF|nr:probable endochitinase [Anopheles coustani]XP_058174046.1 probable endochitinase [Anopheles ziemanni]